MAKVLGASALVLIVGTSCGSAEPPFVRPLHVVSRSSVVLSITRPPTGSLGRGPARLFFFDGLHGFAATTGGAHYAEKVGHVRPVETARLEQTDDGGASWHTVWRGRDVVFNSIVFADRQVGVAAGTSARIGDSDLGPLRGATILVSTRDGGRTWRRLPARPPFPDTFFEECCPHRPPRHGFQLPSRDTWYAFGDGGLRRSTDGGRTWHGRSLPHGTTIVRFASATVGYAAVAARSPCRREQELWKTADGAWTWRSLRGTCSPTYRSLEFLDEHAGFTSAAPATEIYPRPAPHLIIRKTLDGGRTWSTPYADWTGGDRWPADTVLRFSDRRHGWALASEYSQGNVYTSLRTTADGGRTWARRRFPALPTAFAGRRFAWVGAPDEAIVWRTRDAGRTWLTTAAPSAIAADTLVAATRSELVVTTRLGTIRSRDGGTTWKTVPAFTPLTAARTMRRRAFVHTSFTRARGVAYLTRNAGRTWRPLRPTKGWNSSGDVSFGDREHGLIAAGSGESATATPPVYATDDGGASWRRVRTPPGARDETVTLGPGLVVLQASTLNVSVDSGRHWLRLRLPGAFWYCGSARPLHSEIWILCSVIGGGAPSLLFRSDDEGATWRRLRSRTVLNPHLLVAAAGEAWAVGVPRVGEPTPLWHTRDGGRSWRAVWPRLPRDSRMYELTIGQWYSSGKAT